MLPSKARVVVIGGGIIGNSVAYHLSQHVGWGSEVVLLERDQLTSGTTWHAAGLMVTFGSLSETATEIRKYSKELYHTVLEEETGQATGFMPVGFIELATTQDRLEEYRRVAAFNRRCGVDVREISPAEVLSLFPLCNVTDVVAGFYVESDGRVNPVDACMALAKGAKQNGVQIFEGVTVDEVTRSGGKVSGVKVTDANGEKATVEADIVVNCAGMWARQLGELNGVAVPNQAAEHYYYLTEPMADVDPSWPVVEDPSSYTYIRPEGGGLMVGMFEGEGAPWHVDGIPDGSSYLTLDPDFDRMAPYLEKAMARVPRTLEVGMKSLFCGPESFTPDLAPMVGEAPELRNYYVAAGLNSIGILSGPGIGRVLARWIVQGAPDARDDVTGMNLDRLHRFQANPMFRADRVKESLGNVYKCHYPTKAVQSARGARRSPLHDRLATAGAQFTDVSGWESPEWFNVEHDVPAPASLTNTKEEDGSETTVEFVPKLTPAECSALSWGKHKWFPMWEREHRACREGVVLIDMSFMSKFLVQGPDAGAVLDRLSTAAVDGGVETGTISYTQWLDPRGLLEADLTVNKLDLPSAAGREDAKFMVVATDTMHRHVETLMRNRIDDDGAQAYITDVTGGFAQINLQGPHSRALLAELTSVDVSDAAFPFRASREIDVGYARVQCARITYVGELGYELFVPVEHAVHVYERVVAAGEAHGLVHAGLRALSSLRMEKAYRDYGHDMDNTDSLAQVGLGFTCDFTKPGGFVGQDAVVKEKELGAAALPRRLVQVLVTDPAPLLHHGEVLYRDGVVVGDVRAGSYGHTLGGAVGLAMVEATPVLGDGPTAKMTPKSFRESTWEVDIAGTRYPATVSLRPLYDPKNERIKS